MGNSLVELWFDRAQKTKEVVETGGVVKFDRRLSGRLQGLQESSMNLLEHLAEKKNCANPLVKRFGKAFRDA